MATGNKFGWHSGTLTCKDAKLKGDLYVQDDIVFSDVSAGVLGITGGIDMQSTTSAIGIDLGGTFTTAAINIDGSNVARAIQIGTKTTGMPITTSGLPIDTDPNNYMFGLFSVVSSTAATSSDELRGAWIRTRVNANSDIGSSAGWGYGVCGAEVQLKFYGGTTKVYAWQNSALWAQLESEAATTTFYTGSYTQCVLANIGLTTATINPGAVVAGVTINANTSTLTNTGNAYYGLFITDKNTGSTDFTSGIWIADGVATTGITIGDCTTGILLDGDFTTAIDINAEAALTNAITINAEAGVTIGTGISITTETTGLITTGISLTYTTNATACIAATVTTGDTITDGMSLSGAGTYTTGILLDATAFGTGINISGACSTAGIILGSTNKLEFRDTAMYIYSSADGSLDLVSDSYIKLVAPGYGKIVFGGETDWGVGAAGTLIDGTGWDWVTQTVGHVDSGALGAACAAAYHALTVTPATHSSNSSFFGTWTELYLQGTQNMDNSSNCAAVWGQIEMGATVTTTSSADCFTAGGYFNIITGATFVNNAAHAVNGVRVQSEISSTTITNSGRLAAFECLTKSGSQNWDYGLYITGATTSIAADSSINVTITDPTAAKNGIYSLVNASAAWSSGNVVAIRGKVVVTGTTAKVSKTAVWAGIELSTVYVETGLTCAVNAQISSSSAQCPNSIVHIQSLPLNGGDFSNVPYLCFSEGINAAPAGTGSNILFEVGHNAATTTPTIGSGKLFYNHTLQIAVNETAGVRTAFYIPLSTAEGTYTTPYPIIFDGNAGSTSGGLIQCGSAIGTVGHTLDTNNQVGMKFFMSATPTSGRVQGLYIDIAGNSASGGCDIEAGRFNIYVQPSKYAGQCRAIRATVRADNGGTGTYGMIDVAHLKAATLLGETGSGAALTTTSGWMASLGLFGQISSQDTGIPANSYHAMRLDCNSSAAGSNHRAWDSIIGIYAGGQNQNIKALLYEMDGSCASNTDEALMICDKAPDDALNAAAGAIRIQLGGTPYWIPYFDSVT